MFRDGEDFGKTEVNVLQSWAALRADGTIAQGPRSWVRHGCRIEPKISILPRVRIFGIGCLLRRLDAIRQGLSRSGARRIAEIVNRNREAAVHRDDGVRAP